MDFRLDVKAGRQGRASKRTPDLVLLMRATYLQIQRNLSLNSIPFKKEVYLCTLLSGYVFGLLIKIRTRWCSLANIISKFEKLSLRSIRYKQIEKYKFSFFFWKLWVAWWRIVVGRDSFFSNLTSNWQHAVLLQCCSKKLICSCLAAYFRVTFKRKSRVLFISTT